MIPKIIHQIWIQGEDELKNKFPNKYKLTRSFEKHMTNYQHKIWSDTDIQNLIIETNPNLFQIYLDAPNYASKADIGRLVILYEIGGFYADIDYELFTNIDFLFRLEYTAMVVRLDNLKKFDILLSNFRYNNALLACVKNHSIPQRMLEIIENLGSYKNLKSNSYEKNHYNYYTGPTSLSNLIEQEYENKDQTLLIVSNELLEPITMANQNKMCETAEECKSLFPSALGVHHLEGSWIPHAKTLQSIGGMYGKLNEYWPIFMIIFFVLFLTFFSTTIFLMVKLFQ
jgi:mannosyltransferase OCH1-like enzyme